MKVFSLAYDRLSGNIGIGVLPKQYLSPRRRARLYSTGKYPGLPGVRHRQPVGQDLAERGTPGYHAGEKISGHKRRVVVDTLGLILAVVVHVANLQDRDGAKLVLVRLAGLFPRLKAIWADGGHAGQLIAWT